jgi:hypothetical protein
MENLAPGWAQTKRAMILARLHWPSPEKSPTKWVAETGGEAGREEEPMPVAMKWSPITEQQVQEVQL